jgi:hypothetical protein
MQQGVDPADVARVFSACTATAHGGQVSGSSQHRRRRVEARLAECAARFPGGRLFFDSIPPSLSNRTLKGYRTSTRYTAPTAPAEGARRRRVRLTGLSRVAALRSVAFALEQV